MTTKRKRKKRQEPQRTVFATGRMRTVVVDDKTWELAREAAERLSATRQTKVTISMIVRESLRRHPGVVWVRTSSG